MNVLKVMVFDEKVEPGIPFKPLKQDTLSKEMVSFTVGIYIYVIDIDLNTF